MVLEVQGLEIEKGEGPAVVHSSLAVEDLEAEQISIVAFELAKSRSAMVCYATEVVLQVVRTPV
jgi:hypothetical protein